MRRAYLKEMFNDPAKYGDLPALIDGTMQRPADLRDPDYYIIESATPLGLSTVKTDQGEVITLSWLCKSKSKDMYTIAVNYLMDMAEVESDIINEIPFHDENIYITNRAVNDMLLNSFDRYITDMNFRTTDRLCDNKEFTIFAVSIGNTDESCNNKLYEFSVSNNLFASMSYLDNYISENIVNNYEMGYAVVGALQNKESHISAIEFEELFELVAMAPVNKKDTTVAIVFRGKTTESERYTILVPFDIGVKFKKEKFRGMTVEKIENTYLKENDQYLSIFTFNTEIADLEKDYIVIKAKNKNDVTKVFFLDSNIRQNLIDRIKSF